MNVKRKNIICSITADTLNGVAYLCSTGVLMQTFLACLGFSSQLIYINTTIVQSALILVTPLCAKWTDKGNIILRTAAIQLPIALFYLFYMPVCLTQDASMVSFIYLTVTCFAQAVVLAMHSVCIYKLPYFIFSAEDYGTTMAISGVISSVVSLGSGIVISSLSAIMPFTTLMFFACAVAFLFTIGAAWLTYQMKPLLHAEKMDISKIGNTPKSISVWQLFRTPIFIRLLPANFLRGVNGAATSVLAAVALDLGFSTTTATSLVSIQSAASLLSFAFFGFVTRKVQARPLILVSALSMLVFPLVLVRNEIVFLAVVFLAVFGRIVVDNSVPLLLRLAVPVEISGPYNAWRMILYNAGFVLTTAIAAVIPVEALIILGTAAQVIVGINYFTDKAVLENLQPDRIQQ